MIPTSIDGTDITGATIDGTDVQEITVDGQTVFSASLQLSPNLVHRWTFDNADISSSTLTDVWQNQDLSIPSTANTGVSGASQAYTTNEAVDFNGGRAEAPSKIVDGTTTWSVAFWTKDINMFGVVAATYGTFSGSPERFFIKFRTVNGQKSLKLSLSNSNTEETLTNADSSYGDGSWRHFVCTFDESNGMEIYQDGNLVNSTSSATTADHSSVFTVGDEVLGGDPFQGLLDDMRIYSKVLTSSEVSNLYNNGSI